MRPQLIDREVFVQAGRKGGLASAKRLTKKQRVEKARKAIRARWDKYLKAKAVA